MHLLRETQWVRSIALRLVGDHHVAEDVSQQALLAAATHFGSESGSARRSWLFAVVRNLVRRERRSAARRDARERAAARDDAQPSAAEVVVQTESQQRVVAAVLELPEPYRGTLLLRYVHDRSVEAIAREQGVEAVTVRVRTRRALEMLRRRLEDQHGVEWRALLLIAAGGDPSPASGMPVLASRTLLLGVGMKIVWKAAVAVVVVALALALWNFADPANEDVVAPASSAAPAAIVANGKGTGDVEVERAVVAGTSTPVGKSSTPPNYSGPGTVLEGLVVSAQREPVANATVTLIASVGYGSVALSPNVAINVLHRTRTDAEGTFVIEGLAPSVHCELVVRAADFAPRLVETLPGDRAEIVLQPACRLVGRVIDRTSRRPIVGAAVRSTSVRVDGERMELVAESVSDAVGRYAIDDLPGGTDLRLEVVRAGASPLSQRVVLATDGETTHDILVPSLGTLEGVVVDSGGVPIGGAVIRSGAASPRVLTKTDANGRFRLELASRPEQRESDAIRRGQRDLRRANYELLLVHKSGYCQTVQPIADLLACPADQRAIKLVESGAIRGVVVDGEGAPIAGATLQWVHDGAQMVDPGAWIEPGPGSMLARTNAMGRFELADVLWGTAGEVAVLGVRDGAAAPERFGYVTPAGPGETSELRIRLGQGYAVSGRAFVNAEPAKVFVLLSDESDPTAREMIHSDPDGHFAFHGVRSGDYTLKICTFDGTAVWSEPRALVVGELSSTEIDLHVRTEFRALRGTVVTAAGDPIAGRDLYAFRHGRERNERGHRIIAGMGKTRGDGTFEICLNVGAADDTYWIAFPWHGFTLQVRELAADTDEVRIVAPEVAPVALRLVRAADGAAIAAARLAFRAESGAPWIDLFQGRETATGAHGLLKAKLPIGPLELRLASPTSGIDARTHAIEVHADGAELVLRL